MVSSVNQLHTCFINFADLQLIPGGEYPSLHVLAFYGTKLMIPLLQCGLAEKIQQIQMIEIFCNWLQKLMDYGKVYGLNICGPSILL